MARVPTGIEGYDDMLGGGYLPRTANLVEGAPGTGKTTLGMQFIYDGITRHGEPGLILTFEEFPRQYYHDALAFGWDYRRLEQEGMLRVVLTSPEVSLEDLRQVEGQLEAIIHEIGARRVLVDSLSHFDRIAPDPATLRSVFFSFINTLRREGLTAVLTRESPALLGDDSAAGETSGEELTYLVDSYTLLRFVEIDSSLRKALLVLKHRGSAHATDIRQFEIGAGGLEVKARFEGQRGILSGSPQRMAEAFAEAFGRK